MAQKIECDCGTTVRGETEEELLARAEEHVQQAHPEMVGTITREQLRSMAEEE